MMRLQRIRMMRWDFISTIVLVAVLMSCDRNHNISTDEFCQVLQIIYEQYPIEESIDQVYVMDSLTYHIHPRSLGMRKWSLSEHCPNLLDSGIILLENLEQIKADSIENYYLFSIYQSNNNITYNRRYFQCRHSEIHSLVPIIEDPHLVLRKNIWGDWIFEKYINKLWDNIEVEPPRSKE